MSRERRSLTAILGPTNTGKTHLAVERLCAHSSGVMGFPLRLLAREIYDRVAAIKGKAEVALITGEERIEPPGARWYLCTAESMPIDNGRDFAFAALDEVQLAADPERGHIFTDRMLHVRGREETMLLGSRSIEPVIRALLPQAEIVGRPRFSTLSHAGARKLSRLPPRSAIVAFSVEEVYRVAELMRRLRGGAAVVMGALSPRTRNAQVEMFQNGEVDYLVATDAVGMGLNLDVAHVAFASLSKFDGRRQRRLTLSEMAQIAGRAGRHQRDGTFGTLAGEGAEFTEEDVAALEGHHVPPLRQIYWRDPEPRLDSLDGLIADLERSPESPLLEGRPVLAPAPESIDLAVLNHLAADPEIRDAMTNRNEVARLWAVARLPDFRQAGAEHHSRFVAQLWRRMRREGRLPRSWVAAQIASLYRIQGDVDSLSQRIAAARTWAYVAHRPDWTEDADGMAARTAELEQKLSDALHDRLRQRFVDRRTSVLLRGNRAGAAALDVAVENGAVLVEGQEIGRLDGFRFSVASGARMSESRLLLAAAEKYLGGIMSDQARELADSSDNEFRLATDAEGRPAIYWRDSELGVLGAGKSLLKPRLHPQRALSGLEGDALKAVVERAEAWIGDQIAKHLGGPVGLLTLSQGTAVPGPVRALAVQLAEAGGIAGRLWLNDAVNVLDKDERGVVRKAGVVFGALDIFHHAALKPGATIWRLALRAALEGKQMVEAPPASAVHLADWKFASATACRDAGYRRAGEEHLRIDMAEKLIKKAHEARAAAGNDRSFAFDLAFPTSLGLSEEATIRLLSDAGFKRVADPAPKKDVPLAEADNHEAVQEKVGSTPAPQAEAESVPPDPPAGAADVGDAKAVEDTAQPSSATEPQNVIHLRWLGLKRPKKKSVDRQPVTALGEQLAALARGN